MPSACSTSTPWSPQLSPSPRDEESLLRRPLLAWSRSSPSVSDNDHRTSSEDEWARRPDGDPYRDHHHHVARANVHLYDEHIAIASGDAYSDFHHNSSSCSSPDGRLVTKSPRLYLNIHPTPSSSPILSLASKLKVPRRPRRYLCLLLSALVGWLTTLLALSCFDALFAPRYSVDDAIDRRLAFLSRLSYDDQDGRISHPPQPLARPRDYLTVARAALPANADGRCDAHSSGDIVFARPPRTRCGPPSLREKLRVPDTVKLPPVDAPSPYASGSSYAAYYERLMQHAARMVKILYAPPRNGRVAAALQPVTDAYEGYYVDSSFRDLELKEDETGERERGRWGWTGSSWLKARTDDEEEVVPSAKGLGASAVAARVQRLSVRMDGDVDQVMDKSESAPPSPPPPPVLKPTDINANASTALVLIPPPPVPPPTPNYTPTKFSTHFIRMPTSSNATTVEPIHPGTTTIDCAVLDPNVPERYCRTRNLAVRLALVPRVDAREEFDLNPLYGAARATCALNETWWFHGRMFGKGGAGWLYSGMEIVEPEGEYGEIKCDAWVDRTTFFASRWDTTNPYQAHQDFLNTFLVYSALDLDASETQAILLDSRYKDGPFTSAWSHVFSGSRRLMDIRQLADEVLARLPRHKPDPVLCFKDAAWGIHGGISPLSRGASRKDFCSSSPLILAFRSFMLDRLRLAILGPRRAGTTTPPILASDTTTTMSLATAVMERLPLPQELLLPSERHPPISIPTRILSDPIMTQRDALRRALKESAARMRDQHRTITVLYTIRGNGTPLRTVAGLNGEALQGLGSARGGDDVEATSTSPSREPEPLQRKVENEAELIDYLRGVCESWGGVNSTRLLEHGAGRSRGRWGVVDMSRGGGNFTCEFRAVDMAGLTFERQVALAQGTDLLVGAHGAVFIHMMYLRRQPRAAVFEMQPPSRRNGNEQFGNLAGKLGHIYERTSIGKGVSEKEMGIVGQKVRGLLESLKAGRLEHGL